MGKCIEHSKRTMIIGGGVAGQMLMTEIKNAQHSEYEDDKLAAQFDPVCIIDNDPEKIGTEIMGVRIVGPSSDIPHFAK